jgi:hypothetical protein
MEPSIDTELEALAQLARDLSTSPATVSVEDWCPRLLQHVRSASDGAF